MLYTTDLFTMLTRCYLCWVRVSVTKICWRAKQNATEACRVVDIRSNCTRVTILMPTHFHAAPSLKDTNAPPLKDTNAPSLEDTNAPSLKDTNAPSLKDTNTTVLFLKKRQIYVMICRTKPPVMLNNEQRRSFLFSHHCTPILSLRVLLHVSAENKYIRPSSNSMFV